MANWARGTLFGAVFVCTLASVLGVKYYMDPVQCLIDGPKTITKGEDTLICLELDTVRKFDEAINKMEKIKDKSGNCYGSCVSIEYILNMKEPSLARCHDDPRLLEGTRNVGIKLVVDRYLKAQLDLCFEKIKDVADIKEEDKKLVDFFAQHAKDLNSDTSVDSAVMATIQHLVEQDLVKEEIDPNEPLPSISYEVSRMKVTRIDQVCKVIVTAFSSAENIRTRRRDKWTDEIEKAVYDGWSHAVIPCLKAIPRMEEYLEDKDKKFESRYSFHL